MASIRDDAQELGAISWSFLARETAADACFGHLLYLIEHEDRVDVNIPVLASLSPVCGSIYTQDGVLLYYDHVVVPRPSVNESFGTSMPPTKELLRWSSTPVP